MTFQNHLEVGDQVWYCGNGIAIKVLIQELEDWRETTGSPTAAVYYEIDEPVGHAVDYWDKPNSMAELVSDKETAKEVLLAGYKNEIDFLYEELEEINSVQQPDKELMKEAKDIRKSISLAKKGPTLNQYRNKIIDFIKSTWVCNAQSKRETQDIQNHFAEYKKLLREKNHITEWFNIEDVLSGKV